MRFQTVAVSFVLLVWAASSGCGSRSVPAMTPVTSSASPPAPVESAANGPASPEPESPSPHETDAAPEQSDAEPQRTRDISFDDLKFDIQKGEMFERSMLTPKIEALDGKPIRIRGYILPTFLQTGLTQFVLVRDNMSCCFGPGAALYDCVIVEMKPQKSTDFSLYPVAVEGTFSIKEMLDPDGKTVAVFHLDGESVR